MHPRELIDRWVERFNAGGARRVAAAEMVCIAGNIFTDGDWAILEQRDPNGLRGCGVFQRGYWDKLSFLKPHGLPLDT